MSGDAQGSNLRISVLGDLQVLRDGRPLTLPPSRKTRALLGFLALAPRPQARQKLCDLLWEGPGDPRAALRWSLAKLRPLLDDPGRVRVVADKESAAIVLADGELDLLSVRSLVGGRPAGAPVEALRRAALLFRGELLEGLELLDCFRFHEWCTGQRDAARSLRLAILDALVAGLEDDPEEALARARERVAVDPLAERGHVAVVRILGRLRRRREGLEQYEACRRILESAFGSRPSAEMERARLALTSPGAAAEVRLAAPAAAMRAAPAAFVGRARELAALDALVGAALGGRRQVLVVAGEPGIGKSRLLEELDARVRRSGGVILRGRAFEGEALRPYGAWLDALRGAPLGELSEVQRSELAPLLPELGAPAPATDQGRLFDAVVRALLGLCRRGPLALILDDVQWLDEASASLLQVATRALDADPAVVACATRPGELVDNPGALRAVRLLSRADRSTRIDLEPLSRAEIRDLLGRVAPGADADVAWDASEGNPLFAIEVARARQAGVAGSASLDALIADRLATIGGKARDLLPWAAALGRSFQAERLTGVTGMPAAELLSAVDELERRGVLRPSGDERWDFAHDLFRRAAYQSLSEPRRRLVHREIAHALAALPDPDGALAGDVARHAALGDDPSLCAQASLAAGARAVRLFASGEAREIVDRALRLVAQFPPARRIPISLALMRIAVDASRAGGGDPTLPTRITALVEEARREGLGPEVVAGYAVLAHAHWANHDDAGTTEAAAVGGDALRDVSPQEAALDMAELVACFAVLERDLPRARMLAAEARRFAPLAPRAAANLALGEGMIASIDGRAEEAAAILERAQRDCREALPWEESQLCARLALLDLELGRPERVFERTARMREVGPRFGDGSAEAFANLLEAAARGRLGEDVPAEEVAVDLAALEVDSKLRLAQAACALGEVDLAAGRIERARRLLRRACAAADAVSRPSVAVTARALLARAELARGNARAAREHVEAARGTTHRLLPTSRAVCLLREVAAAAGLAATPLLERGPSSESASGVM
jgi:DNA-binding SARP family transcriptional activator/tetratricopeptide (TPR) repeat protein